MISSIFPFPGVNATIFLLPNARIYGKIMTMEYYDGKCTVFREKKVMD